MNLTEEDQARNMQTLKMQGQSLFTIGTRGPEGSGYETEWLATTIYRCEECKAVAHENYIYPHGRGHRRIATSYLALGIAVGRASKTCPHVGPFLNSLEIYETRPV